MLEASRIMMLGTAMGLLLCVARIPSAAQAPVNTRSAPESPASPLFSVPPAPAVYKLGDAFLRWPLAPGDRQYGAIDGRHLHTLVVEQSNISRRFRDQGYPQYWGRIIGSSADAESADWLAGKFREIGLSDVRIQSLPIPKPVWEPVQPWDIVAIGSGKTLHLTSAQPPYESPAAPAGGMDLEAVYAGTGSEADFQDVRFEAKQWWYTVSRSLRRHGRQLSRKAFIDARRIKEPPLCW